MRYCYDWPWILVESSVLLLQKAVQPSARGLQILAAGKLKRAGRLLPVLKVIRPALSDLLLCHSLPIAVRHLHETRFALGLREPQAGGDNLRRMERPRQRTRYHRGDAQVTQSHRKACGRTDPIRCQRQITASLVAAFRGPYGVR